MAERLGSVKGGKIHGTVKSIDQDRKSGVRSPDLVKLRNCADSCYYLLLKIPPILRARPFILMVAGHRYKRKKDCGSET